MNTYSIAFYNTENFYSKSITENIFKANLEKWIDHRYDTKVNKIAYAISKIGKKETNQFPLMVGLAEIENEDVLNDLINNEHLKDASYKYIFHPSLDERNINVALLYQKDLIEILSSKPIRIIFKDSNNNHSYTRDVLEVCLKLKNEIINVFVVHLPSNIDREINKEKRKLLLKKIRTISQELLKKQQNIIVLGDFNDIPNSEDIREILKTNAVKEATLKNEFFNPMMGLMSYKRGTIIFNKQWLLYDQILFSPSFLTKNSAIKLIKTNIFDENFLRINLNKSDSPPARSFVGTKFLGGYSDHFPVYAIIKYKN